VFILKGVKVVCFDTLLQVLILNDLNGLRDLGLCFLFEDFGSEERCRPYLERPAGQRGIQRPNCGDSLQSELLSHLLQIVSSLKLWIWSRQMAPENHLNEVAGEHGIGRRLCNFAS
jgi:hypothetical protein